MGKIQEIIDEYENKNANAESPEMVVCLFNDLMCDLDLLKIELAPLEYIKANPHTLNLISVDDDGLFYTHSMNLSDTTFKGIILKIKRYLEE